MPCFARSIPHDIGYLLRLNGAFENSAGAHYMKLVVFGASFYFDQPQKYFIKVMPCSLNPSCCSEI